MEVAPLSWSDIPVELAGLVLGRLAAHVDRVRFAAVCPQWRAAARQGGLPPPMPLLLLPDATVYSLPGSEPLRFTDCAGYSDACGIGNWLVFSGEDGFFLRDPFSKASVTLPALSRAQLRRVGDDKSVDEADHPWLEMEKEKEMNLSKILTSENASKIMFCSPQLITAIFVSCRSYSCWIAVCQPGATSWWSVHVGPRDFVDILFYQGKLYVLDSVESLFAVDISLDHSTGNPWVSQIQRVIGGPVAPGGVIQRVPNYVLIETLTYLVESCGAMLLVCRTMYLRLKAGLWDRIEVLAAEQNRFEVYKANFEQSRWAMMTTLGADQVLFLRRRCCRSVCISHNKMPGDGIFFMENEEEYCCHSKEASSSYSVYDMRDGKVSTPSPTVSWKRGTVFAAWLFPQG